jgi:hypothetical protein
MVSQVLKIFGKFGYKFSLDFLKNDKIDDIFGIFEAAFVKIV